MTTLSREPIYVELGGRQRELRFNANAFILLRDVGYELKPLTEKVESGRRVMLDSLRAYLWAALAKDARDNKEALSLDQVGDFLAEDKDILPSLNQVNKALLRFYGQEPKPEGEAKAAAAAGGSKSRGRSKRVSASSAAS